MPSNQLSNLKNEPRVMDKIVSSSPKKYVEVLIPGSSECDLFGNWVLKRGNQVKMRLLGWALNQNDWYPY